jgi:hypothetical protein
LYAVHVLGQRLLVVAGLVPATPITVALCLSVRGRRDKPGDDAVCDSTQSKFPLETSLAVYLVFALAAVRYPEFSQTVAEP